MAYEPKSYDHLKGAAKCLSDGQLDQHFTLYRGYVAKLNEIEAKLAGADGAKSNYSFSEYSELKRREAVAFNGAFLHELYFENLGADGDISPALQAALGECGGRDRVVADLTAAALCGPGWALLTHNRRDGRLHTYFIAEHHLGLPIEQDILVALDSWEHAFMIDYGIKRADYVGAFMDNIKWGEVSRRFALAKR
jgi:Fe-Mn family superoxide dismutase